jgi:tetratricopeptide (TPR) repeat protein
MKKIAFLLAASLLPALACSSDDEDGDDGAQDGAQSDDGGDDSGGNDDDGDSPVEEVPEEITRFFDSFHAARYSEAEDRAAALDAAAEADPEHGPLAFDRALAHTWHVTEAGRDPSPDPEALEAEAASLVGLFQTAYEKNPDDDRVGCFLGVTLMNAGRATRNDELTQQGVAVLDQAVQAWPEFNLFCVGLAYDHLPASHPDFARAVDAAFETMDVCYGGPIDRDNPDISPYLDQATDEGIKRVCWNDWIAPHNWEGFYMWMGDILVKQGRIDAALVAYNNSTLSTDYANWPYRSLLEERLDSDLEAKAALYQDDDPANDPPFAGEEVSRSCAVCHAATAEE